MLCQFLAQTNISKTNFLTSLPIAKYNFEMAFSPIFIQSEGNIYVKDSCQIEEATGHLHVGMKELMKQYMYDSWIFNMQIHKFY